MTHDGNGGVAIACGGTGGHFYPALAVARAIAARGEHCTFLVAGHHAAEQLALAREAGFAARPAQALRLPATPLAALLFPWRFLRAVRAARGLLQAVAPRVVLGMGSFASVPVGLAAARLHLPLVLHEGNVVTGRANRFLSRRARVLATSFPEQADRARLRCPCRCTGLPLRPALVAAATQPQDPAPYLTSLGLDPAPPVLLVFGGSQGARFLNDALPAAAALLAAEERRRFQALHFTGEEDNAARQDHWARAGVRCAVRRAESAMHNAYLAAGLIVCRAGAATLFELALFRRPALLVPLPSAAEDHQSANARAAARLARIPVLAQADATPAALAAHLQAWLRDPVPCAEAAARLQALAVPDAAARLADLVIEHARA